MENILQRFSCISFVFKPPWYNDLPNDYFNKKAISVISQIKQRCKSRQKHPQFQFIPNPLPE